MICFIERTFLYWHYIYPLVWHARLLLIMYWGKMLVVCFWYNFSNCFNFLTQICHKTAEIPLVCNCSCSALYTLHEHAQLCVGTWWNTNSWTLLNGWNVLKTHSHLLSAHEWDWRVWGHRNDHGVRQTVRCENLRRDRQKSIYWHVCGANFRES